MADKLPMNRSKSSTALLLLLTFAFIPMSYLIPLLDSTTPPYIELTSGLSSVMYWISESGSKRVVPFIGLFMLLLLVTRKGLTGKRRAAEALLVFLAVAVCAGGGAALNEHAVKPQFAVARPNVVFLAGENGAGALGMTPEQFYAAGDKAARRIPMAAALHVTPETIAISPLIMEHWIEETGYSFPSGHAFGAMFFATFFFALGIMYVSGWRMTCFYLLLPWAVAVSWSRTLLRVHTPTDISVGALEGLVLGVLAFLIVRKVLNGMIENA